MAKIGPSQTRFRFTRRERRGSLFLILLLLLIVFIPYFFKKQYQPLTFEYSEQEKKKVERIQKNLYAKQKRRESYNSNKYSKSAYSKKERKKYDYQPFDPDTLSQVQWQELGLSERQAEVLISYKNRLGGFSNIEQLYAAYVLDSNRVNEWKPFLRFNKKARKQILINLNSASAEELKSLKGIGEVLSKRIIEYREKLGGFHSTEQLAEVYGLSVEVLENIQSKLTVDPREVRPISINEVDMKSLAAHPYFDFRTAKLIVNYRDQHGAYSTMKELVKSKGIEAKDSVKLYPYITFAR